MLGYILRRLAEFLPVLFVIVSLSFFLMRLAPGGPFDQERALPEQVRANIEARYHLDEPLWRQYLQYLGEVARGDLGPSFRYPDRSVNELLGLGFPVSLTLGLCALALALGLGGTAGILAGLRRNSILDYLTMSFALGGVSVPNFVLGPILMLIFALGLGWLPVAGWGTWRHLVLPSFTLGTFYAAYVARLTRAGMLEVIGQDFIRTARAKGLREAVVVLRHALPGAVLPVVTYLGPASAALLTGSV
ncbi:MAG: ABC transporter permease subunit, partial [candidate division NC10 bacterium]